MGRRQGSGCGAKVDAAGDIDQDLQRPRVVRRLSVPEALVEACGTRCIQLRLKSPFCLEPSLRVHLGGQRRSHNRESGSFRPPPHVAQPYLRFAAGAEDPRAWTSAVKSASRRTSSHIFGLFEEIRRVIFWPCDKRSQHPRGAPRRSHRRRSPSTTAWRTSPCWTVRFPRRRSRNPWRPRSPPP